MLRTKHLAIRWRLTGWVLLIVFAIIAVGGFVVVQLVHDRFVEELDADNRQITAEVLVALDVFGADVLVEAAERGVGSSDQVLLLLGADGVEWAFASGSSDAPDPLPDVGDLDVGGLRSRSGEPFDLAGADGVPDYRMLPTQLGDGNVLLVGTPLDELEQGIRGIVGVLLLVAVVAAIVMTVVVSFVAASVTRPLQGMVASAERIGSGALDERVDVEGIDEVARLAAALNAMLDRLEQAFADRQASEDKLRRFVADASHELRTPITTVLGYAELIQSGMVTSDDEIQRSVGRISSEGERMRLLVEELLLLARLDEQRAVDRIAVDLSELVLVAVGDARATAPERTIEVHSCGVATVLGDPLSLRQAVDNLITNVRVHTPDGTRIEVTVDRVDDAVTVSVDDDGPGVAPVDVPHLFDRFFRAESSRARPGGAGLGLSIVDAVVDAHGGEVSASASPAGGARFTITLPAASAADQS